MNDLMVICNPTNAASMDDTSNGDCKDSFGKDKRIQHSVTFKPDVELASLDDFDLDMKCSNSEVGLLYQNASKNQKDSHKSTSETIRQCLSKYGKLLGSLMARLLFLSHSIVCVLIAVSSIHSPYIYLLICPMCLMVAEAYLTLKVRKNVEWKWFTPCIAIYQLCTVPSIWLLEYRQFEAKRHSDLSLTSTTATTLVADAIVAANPSTPSFATTETLSTAVANVANVTGRNLTQLYGLLVQHTTNSSAAVSTSMGVEVNATATENWQTVSDMFSTAEVVAENFTSSSGSGTLLNDTADAFSSLLSGSLVANMTSNITYLAMKSPGITHGTHSCETTDGISNIPPLVNVSLIVYIEQYCLCSACVPLLEQILLLFMIIGRWLLPRGEHLSRDQKAQLLLVNIAIAADILELFEIMKEEKVLTNELLITVVLSLWSISLIQFAIVSTATAKKAWKNCSCFESEIWSLMTLLFLDDLPFLIFRLVCIIHYNITSYSSYFFASKNLLVLALDINRIIALYKENKKQKREQAQSTELIQMGPQRRSVGRIRR